MTDLDPDAGPAQPCGFGIFVGGELLAAFPSRAKAREVLQSCEQDGYRTESMAMQPIFTAPLSSPDAGRVAALEAELQRSRDELASLRQRLETMCAELLELRKAL